MSVDKEETEITRRYLLGSLPPEDAAGLEESYFSDDETFEEVEIAEDDLVDAYVRDELSPTERKYFERRLLILPRLAERVEFARVLEHATRTAGPSSDPSVTPANQSTSSVSPATKRTIKEREVESSDWKSRVSSWLAPPRIGFAVSILVLLVAGGFLFSEWMRLRQESQRLALERSELQRQNEVLVNQAAAEKHQLSEELRITQALNEKLAEALDQVKDVPARIALMSPLTLYPGSSRAPGESANLVLPGEIALVRLRLALESNDYVTYQAVVYRGVNGPVAWKSPKLKPSTTPSGSTLELKFPTSRLTPADYVVRVDGEKPPSDPEFIATYHFRAVAKVD